MTALWKNSPYLSWWGREYADGAVVEECYLNQACSAAQFLGSRLRDDLHRASRPHPVRLG
jgi:hypothetical protein